MATTKRETDLEVLAIMAGDRDLTSDQLESMLFARGLQIVGDELMALALDSLVDVYVNDRGAICIMGAEGEPIKLSELIVLTLEDETLSVFGDDGENGEGEYNAEDQGYEETVLH